MRRITKSLFRSNKFRIENVCFRLDVFIIIIRKYKPFISFASFVRKIKICAFSFVAEDGICTGAIGNIIQEQINYEIFEEGTFIL